MQMWRKQKINMNVMMKEWRLLRYEYHETADYMWNQKLHMIRLE